MALISIGRIDSRTRQFRWATESVFRLVSGCTFLFSGWLCVSFGQPFWLENKIPLVWPYFVSTLGWTRVYSGKALMNVMLKMKTSMRVRARRSVLDFLVEWGVGLSGSSVAFAIII